MNKRDFIKTSGLLLGGALLTGFMGACNNEKKEAVATDNTTNATPTTFALPQLAYAYNAIEPVIDAMTMEIHHSKHHAAYVTNLNKALEANPNLSRATIEEICANLAQDDTHTAVRNNGGGHYNHSLFWTLIAPKEQAAQTKPSTELAAAIDKTFGSLDNMKKELIAAAASRFGSGWGWLSIDSNKNLFISSTPNQDNPLMKNLVEKPGTPLIGIDVWEHAYYLHYQNKRQDYLTAFFDILNWDTVNANYSAALR